MTSKILCCPVCQEKEEGEKGVRGFKVCDEWGWWSHCLSCQTWFLEDNKTIADKNHGVCKVTKSTFDGKGYRLELRKARKPRRESTHVA